MRPEPEPITPEQLAGYRAWVVRREKAVEAARGDPAREAIALDKLETQRAKLAEAERRFYALAPAQPAAESDERSGAPADMAAHESSAVPRQTAVFGRALQTLHDAGAKDGPEARILALCCAEARPLNREQIALRLSLTNGAVVHHVAKLVGRGLLEYFERPDKPLRIVATRAGSAAMQRAMAADPAWRDRPID